MNNLPPFYIGQKVVRTETDTNGILKVGQEFTVRNIIFCCTAWQWRIDIGQFYKATCSGCHKDTSGCPWAAKNFKAVNQDFESIKLEKILELETPLICVN